MVELLMKLKQKELTFQVPVMSPPHLAWPLQLLLSLPPQEMTPKSATIAKSALVYAVVLDEQISMAMSFS